MSEEGTEAGERKRNPRYHVFERIDALTADDMREALQALAATLTLDAEADCAAEIDKIMQNARHLSVWGWFRIGEAIPAPTDRKAITRIVGTPDEPTGGFDAERRALPHAAVLVTQWHERHCTRKVEEPTAADRAKADALLAAKVTETWE